MYPFEMALWASYGAHVGIDLGPQILRFLPRFPVPVVVVLLLGLVDVQLDGGRGGLDQRRGSPRVGGVDRGHVGLPGGGAGEVLHPVVILVSGNDRVGVALNPHLQNNFFF